MGQLRYSVTFNNQIEEYKKSILVDPDKSLSIRSILFGSISEGISEIKNLLRSDDVNSAINFIRKLGIKFKKVNENKYLVYGQGLGSLFISKNKILDFGNSGTLCRLGCGILSTSPNLNVRLTGDKSLKKRNLSTMIDALEKFGATFYPQKKNYLPLQLVSSNIPTGIDFVEKKGSAQIVSSVSLAAINSFGKTKIVQEKISRNHTQIFLKKIGSDIYFKKSGAKNIIEINEKKKLNNFKIEIPGDPSSAAFFTALTLLKKKSLLTIRNMGLNPTRIGFYELLKKHGAKIKIKNIRKKNNELVGDIFVKSSKIKPIKCGSSYYSRTVDEFPILFVISALTEGISKFYGIEDLANKESNRILEMKNLLKKINIKCKSNKNSMKINGKKNYNFKNKLITVDPKLDHRICQSASILALATGINIKIKNFQTVNTSAPSFLKIVKKLGGKFEIKKN